MRANEQGFSMVEILVGLGVGMLAMVVVMQVYSQNEAQKRSTTGGADATGNGGIALTMIERDTRNAGWGMDVTLYSECTNTFTYCDGSAACGGKAGAIAGFSLQNIVITDGGAKPDSIALRYYADPNFGTFQAPTNAKLRKTMPQPSAELEVTSTQGCQEGNLMLMTQGGNCAVLQVTQVQGPALKIQHNPGAHGNYNPSENIQKELNWPAFSKGATLTCFAAPANGSQFRRSYAIDTERHALQRSDNANGSTANNEVVAPEIVDLQAEYGVAPATPPHSQAVGSWVPATGAWAAPSAASLASIKAVRIALVARSTQYEKPAPNKECVTTTQADVDKWSTWAKFTPANYSSDWKCYRYKVFETVVPLKNVLWGNV